MASPLYLPVEEPIGRPTVHAFGRDFGHGALDQRHFQPATEGALALPPTLLCADAHAVHAAAQRWLDTTLQTELGVARMEDADALDTCARYAARLARVAEDVVVLHRGAGEGRIVALHVRAPSGWRPERTLGASLTALHTHVPGLLDRASGEQLTRMMIDRGPYVRFVWGVHTCGALDHHPDRVRKSEWADAEGMFLRVERQVTVPLPDADAAVFLIRVYVHPLEALDATARERLAKALDGLSPALRAYKGLPADPRALDRFFRR